MLAFPYTPYVAVIGDIKNSKQIKDRLAFQDRFKALLQALNLEYRAEIASGFMVTLGDEFQGLLTNGRSVPYIIDRIEREMHPVRLRFGIGIGEITTAIDPSMPLGADGPAYNLARDMINAVKLSETKNKMPRKNAALQIQGQPELSGLLNTIFNLLAELQKGRTDRQTAVINQYLQGTYTQADIADNLQLKSQSSVQRALAGAGYYTCRDALETLSHSLQIQEEHHV